MNAKDQLNNRAREDVFSGKMPASRDTYYMERYNFWQKVKIKQKKYEKI